MDKRNHLDQLPLAELGDGELNQIKELERSLTEKYNQDIYLMALKETK
ncbi:hypothetical protein [Natranaerofaba carboxydovora]|nr:hypothetical protein [Natranaerofaba carboxydovora]